MQGADKSCPFELHQQLYSVNIQFAVLAHAACCKLNVPTHFILFLFRMIWENINNFKMF